MIFSSKLEALKDKGRYRSLSLPAGVDLTSNDYLGLAGHPAIRAAAIDYLEGGGAIGAAGSRLLRGHCNEHAQLEAYAAEFFVSPAALYLSSGYQANMAIFQALPSRHDVIIYDEFVHASAREAIQNSPAKSIKALHNNMQSFEDALKKSRLDCKGQVWIAVESVYSMDGDIAPLSDLYAMALRYDAVIVIDEAHGSGIMGDGGRGVSADIIAAHGYDRIITLHTCGKAMGVAGGLICASRDVVEMMINAARGFIYSTAPMPLQAHLVRVALGLVGSSDGDARRMRLDGLSRAAQGHFGGAGTCIVPIIIGDDKRCVNVANTLQEKGWDIRAIRPPSVPEGSARLRLSLNADLGVDVLDAFAADYATVMNV